MRCWCLGYWIFTTFVDCFLLFIRDLVSHTQCLLQDISPERLFFQQKDSWHCWWDIILLCGSAVTKAYAGRDTYLGRLVTMIILPWRSDLLMVKLEHKALVFLACYPQSFFKSARFFANHLLLQEPGKAVNKELLTTMSGSFSSSARDWSRRER